ncbi:MAG: cytochrome c3 family protein [Desulfobulbaceae bacterium]|nr:cytochrome c3 family protein [Desulfobulbaceae bacterium]
MLFLNKFFPAFFLFAALCLAAVSAVHAGGYPHYLQNGIECTSCHNVHGDQSKLLWEQPVQQDIDHTPANQLCWSCHNDAEAPAVLTHSSLQTGNTHGNWTVECVVCHDPHFQRQALTNSNDYIAQGVVATVEATTIRKAGAADWIPDAYQGMIVFPSRNRMYTSYMIVGNSANTLTVDPDISTPQVDGSMDLGQVSSGDTFVISYGRLIRAQIDLGRIQEYTSSGLPLPDPTYPKSGYREVKFIRPAGLNSFADGDAAINGICEVCHTRTSHWRNDGTLAGIGVHSGLGGGNCLVCHKHADGFAPYDHLAEGTVAPSPDCIVCHESVDPVSDVHSSNCGLCHVSSFGAGPLVEPYETNSPSGGECIDCHSSVSGSHDEVSHIAAPGQDWVLIFSEGDHEPGVLTWDGEVLVDCTRCHTTNLIAAHAQLCATCHPTPVNTLGTWNKGCQQGGCHTSYHAESNVLHFPFDNNEDCTQCHDQYNWSVPQSNCSNCHSYPGIGLPVTSSNARETYTGPAVIDFSVTTGGKVGVGFTFYRLDGESADTGSTIIVSEPGEHTLEFWTVDQAGRTETPHKTATFTIIEDTAPPATTSNALAAYWQYALIKLNAADNGDLGVKATYYRLDGGSPQTGTSIYVPGVAGTGAHTLEFWSEDWSGNVEALQTVSFTITAGTATLRLIWGDSDTAGPPPLPPEVDAYWYVYRGSYGGTPYNSGYVTNSDENWTGVDDVTIPVSPTSYYISIDWWDSNEGWYDNYSGSVEAKTPGEIIIIRY